MVDKSSLGNSLKEMSDRETVFDHILSCLHILQSHLVACRNPGEGGKGCTIDVEAATSLDIVNRHRHIVGDVYLYEFCHDYAITLRTAARIPSFCTSSRYSDTRSVSPGI